MLRMEVGVGSTRNENNIPVLNSRPIEKKFLKSRDLLIEL